MKTTTNRPTMYRNLITLDGTVVLQQYNFNISEWEDITAEHIDITVLVDEINEKDLGINVFTVAWMRDPLALGLHVDYFTIEYKKLAGAAPKIETAHDLTVIRQQNAQTGA